MQKRGRAATSAMLSRRWRWVASAAAAPRRRRSDSNWVDVEEMLKARLATIFEDPAAEDEETTRFGSSRDHHNSGNNEEEEEEMRFPSKPTASALVARKGAGGNWRKVKKELRRRFKKTRMLQGASDFKASSVYFFAGFVSKGRAFHSSTAAYL